jgi:hypothetical protein
VKLPDASLTTDLKQRSDGHIDLTTDATATTTTGDTVNVNATITNDGNVTLHDLSGAVDAQTDRPTAHNEGCGSDTLAPHASITCSFPKTVTLVDLDAGEMKTTVKAHASTPDGTTVTLPSASITISLTQAPTISIKVDAPQTAGANETITLVAHIKNTGQPTVRLSSVLGSKLGMFTCQAVTLHPNRETECLLVTSMTPSTLHDRVTATGHSQNATRIIASATVTVEPGRLASTGSDLGYTGTAGALLLLAGIIAAIAANRRNRRKPAHSR